MEREPVRWFGDDLEPALDEARVRVARVPERRPRRPGVRAQRDDRRQHGPALAPLPARRPHPGRRPRVQRDPQRGRVCRPATARHSTWWHCRSRSKVPSDIIERVLDAVRPRTRLVVLSAITSPTAVVMPIVELAHALTRRGLELLVDGAHAPGQVPVDLGRPRGSRRQLLDRAMPTSGCARPRAAASSGSGATVRRASGR